MPHKISDQISNPTLAAANKFGDQRALLPGRPYGVENEAKRIIRSLDVSRIGGGTMANAIVGGIKGAVAKAMEEARNEIGGATTELVAEIRDGAKNVKRAIQAEVLNVRKEFSEIVGNATAEADEAVAQVREQVREEQRKVG